MAHYHNAALDLIPYGSDQALFENKKCCLTKHSAPKPR